ncbi:MAG: sigma-54-dependent transcriptional regulator [Clostridium sp.]|uniref:sigma-54-dependent transcriptional regulator n=1 Tax=Clostridium sp. TaxID=1506 RepID=UPI003D6C9621
MKYEIVYETLKDLCVKQLKQGDKVIGYSTDEIASLLNMERTNVAREFGKLIKEGLIYKSKGRPVLYYLKNINSDLIVTKDEDEIQNKMFSVFDTMIGNDLSLKNVISIAKAAIVYPPRGLHTLIIGETGVGKSFFAKCMFKYALEIKTIKDKNRFAVFNCADYVNNSQLLIAHIFGVKKGAYTGAIDNQEGIIEKARDGIIFLDEVHRLPPQGQEMLFTLIDEGKYTPLGSTQEININIMIICATTENIKSSLLKTFTRRIPVTISLPNLRERTVEERIRLIESFYKDESKRVLKKIEIEEDALTALLNYDCTSNIGELKSNIQISCAKAFLRSMFSDSLVKVKLEDFSDEVRTGLLMAKKIKPRNFNLITNSYLNSNNKDEQNNEDKENNEDKYRLSENIYEFIEMRTKNLQAKGLDRSAIENKLSSEVEKFINSYLTNINNTHKEDDIKRIINNELYDFLNKFMYLAEYKLKRKITKNIFLGLLVHIDTFLGRINENRTIENPKIDEIRKKYSEEFKIAMKLAEMIEQKYKIDVPIDEIGFITMFFAADVEKGEGRVLIIVAMHGNSTATSMVEVSNQLLDTNFAIPFDMPLSMKPETALHEIEELIIENHEGVGVILLVDMGSLKFFDKIIANNTGIEVKAVDMTTTAMVIEATRKAIMNQEIDEIVKSIDLESRFLGNFLGESVKLKKDVIITACSTGQGTAQKLKDIIYSKFDKDKHEVINLSIKDKEEFIRTVENIKKESNIVAIISAFNLKIKGIKYICLSDFFKDFMGEDFEEYISDEKSIEDIKTVYTDYLEIEDGDYIVNSFIEIVSTMKYTFDIYMDSEKLNGVLMHFGCLVQRLINKEDTPKCKNIKTILSRNGDVFSQLKLGLANLEKRLKITFSEDDLTNIVEILKN